MVIISNNSLNNYYLLNSLSLFRLAQNSEFLKSVPGVNSADYTIIISRALKVMGNHVKFAHFVLLTISEEAKTHLIFLFNV